MCQCRDPGRVGTGTCASPKLHPTEKSQVLTVRSRPIHQPAARMESYETKGRRHFGEAQPPVQDRSASPRPPRTRLTTSPAQSPVAPASPHRSRDQLPLGDGWTITPSTRRATHRQKPWPKDRPVPQLPDGFARPHCFPPRSLYPSASSDSGSACSTPDHDYGRTLSAPSRSSHTTLPAALSPLDYDDHLPLQTLRSYQESTTAKPHLTGAFPLTLTIKALGGLQCLLTNPSQAY